jgi:hypothetical protein
VSQTFNTFNISNPIQKDGLLDGLMEWFDGKKFLDTVTELVLIFFFKPN